MTNGIPEALLRTRLARALAGLTPKEQAEDLSQMRLPETRKWLVLKINGLPLEWAELDRKTFLERMASASPQLPLQALPSLSSGQEDSQ